MLTAGYRRVVAVSGIDRAIVFTLFGRTWLAIGGLIGLVLVGKCLSPAEQGFYYTFGSLLALQVFVELGLTNVIMQYASHERAALHMTSRGLLEGQPAAKSRLAALLRLAIRWYGAAAIIFTFVLLVTGGAFFTCCGHHAHVAWQLPWTATVLATAGTLLVMPVMALLEGCGLVAEVARFRLFQSVAANLLLWLALWAGAGLATASVFAWTNVCVAVLWLVTSQRPLLHDLLSVTLGERFDWFADIWPYQWRIGVSWLSGYCIFQLFTPVLFAFDGPAAAGRMGMTLTLAGAVSSLGASWLTTKTPQFGMLVSQRKLAELDGLFRRSLQRALCVSALAAGVAWGLVFALNALQHPLAARLLPPLPMATLLLATLINVIVMAEAIYLRAFKREPFLLVSLLSAVLVAAWTLSIGRIFGALGMMLGYLLISATVGLGCGTWIFISRRRAWHEELCRGNVSGQPIAILSCGSAHARRLPDETAYGRCPTAITPREVARETYG